MELFSRDLHEIQIDRNNQCVYHMYYISTCIFEQIHISGHWKVEDKILNLYRYQVIPET